MSGAVFRVDGERFLPMPVARARWYPDALHGGPVAALFARQVERVPAATECTVARLTVDLMRPVPAAPLQVTTEVARAGKRIQVVTASMTADGVEVARASALRIRTDYVPVPEHDRRMPPPGPDGFETFVMTDAEGEWFHTRAVEARFVEGDFYEPGPATVWMRMVMPLVAGEEASPLQRVAALADFGNGLSRVLGEGWLFINADLSIHLNHYPRSEWVAMRSRTEIDDGGVGLAQSELFDTERVIGRSLQDLLVDRWDSEWA